MGVDAGEPPPDGGALPPSGPGRGAPPSPPGWPRRGSTPAVDPSPRTRPPEARRGPPEGPQQAPPTTPLGVRVGGAFESPVGVGQNLPSRGAIVDHFRPWRSGRVGSYHRRERSMVPGTIDSEVPVPNTRNRDGSRFPWFPTGTMGEPGNHLPCSCGGWFPEPSGNHREPWEPSKFSVFVKIGIK